MDKGRVMSKYQVFVTEDRGLLKTPIALSVQLATRPLLLDYTSWALPPVSPASY